MLFAFEKKKKNYTFFIVGAIKKTFEIFCCPHTNFPNNTKPHTHTIFVVVEKKTSTPPNTHHQQHSNIKKNTKKNSNQKNVKSGVSALSSTSSSFGTAAASARFDTHTNGIDDEITAQALAEEEAAMNQYKVCSFLI